MEPWAEIMSIGRQQGGPVSVRQAMAAGVSRSAFDRRVVRERWERPFSGVVILPGRQLDPDVVARAAALGVGPHASVTGATALAIHGVSDRFPARVHLVVPRPHRSRRRLAGVRILESRTLKDADLGVHQRIGLVTVPRAFLDAAATTGLEQLRAWLVDGRQRGVVDVAAVVARTVAAVSARGRGRLLAACRDVDESAADSVLAAEVERRLVRLGFHLDVPARTVRVPGRVLHPDLTLRGSSIGIEVDGFGTHRSRSALDLDQRKHNAYTLAGWTVLRIGWSRMGSDWDGFVGELRVATAGQVPGVTPRG